MSSRRNGTDCRDCCN